MQYKYFKKPNKFLENKNSNLYLDTQLFFITSYFDN